MQFQNIFVTVGTTKFDSLINAINTPEIAEILKSFNCKKLTIQYGTGKPVEMIHNLFQGINIESYTLKESIQADIDAADLVISHAGAGSCIEILNARKPLMVVINELLMGNHQLELAEQLAADKHIFYCTPPTLESTLKTIDLKELVPYKKGDVNNLIPIIDEFVLWN